MQWCENIKISLKYSAKKQRKSLTRQAVKLPLAVAVASEAEPVDSVFGENLDPVIGRVGYDNRVVRTHGDASGPSEQSGLAAARPEGQQQRLLLHQVGALVAKVVAVSLVVVGIVPLLVVCRLLAVSAPAAILVLQVPAEVF